MLPKLKIMCFENFIQNFDYISIHSDAEERREENIRRNVEVPA